MEEHEPRGQEAQGPSHLLRHRLEQAARQVAAEHLQVRDDARLAQSRAAVGLVDVDELDGQLPPVGALQDVAHQHDPSAEGLLQARRVAPGLPRDHVLHRDVLHAGTDAVVDIAGIDGEAHAAEDLPDQRARRLRLAEVGLAEASRHGVGIPQLLVDAESLVADDAGEGRVHARRPPLAVDGEGEHGDGLLAQVADRAKERQVVAGDDIVVGALGGDDVHPDGARPRVAERSEEVREMAVPQRHGLGERLLAALVDPDQHHVVADRARPVVAQDLHLGVEGRALEPGERRLVAAGYAARDREQEHDQAGTARSCASGARSTGGARARRGRAPASAFRGGVRWMSPWMAIDSSGRRYSMTTWRTTRPLARRSNPVLMSSSFR